MNKNFFNVNGKLITVLYGGSFRGKNRHPAEIKFEDEIYEINKRMLDALYAGKIIPSLEKILAGERGTLCKKD